MPARSVVVIAQACSMIAVTLLAAGCAGTGTAATGENAAARNAPAVGSQSGGTPSAPQASTAKPAGPAAAAIPAGAKYTIMCMAFPGAGNAQMAAQSKETLVRGTGRKEFYVVHDENQSTIYFGYYREYERGVDPVEAQRADADLKYLKTLVDGDGRPPFARSMFVPLPAADPDAPAEYDLSRVDAGRDLSDPDRKYWSIAIAAYTADATPDREDIGKNRKQLAVESVMAARKMGIEAYYYHGPAMSMVCIGAWPRRAVRAQMTDTEIKRTDNGDPILVSNVRLPDKLREEIDNSGKHVTVVEPNVQIDDPSLLTTWKDYRYYEVNGKTDVAVTVDPNTGQRKEQIKGTFLVEIPLAQPKGMLSTGRSTQAAQPARAPETNPLLPGQGTMGGLRSVTP